MDAHSCGISAACTLRIEVKIWRMPVEVADPIPFDQDRTHASYDPDYVQRFWRVLLSVDAILNQFRSGFLGRYSRVHFFWGSDLAIWQISLACS